MKKYILMLCAFFIILNANAQNKTGNIKGAIQNTRQEPLAGITVQLANTNLGTTTDSNGVFIIKNIPGGNYTLIFSGVGYKVSKENILVKPGEKTTVNLQLNETTKELETVVIKANKPKRFTDTVSSAGLRMPLKIIETPQSMQVITHDLIKDQQAQNLNDVTKNMVGVISNNNYSSYTQRGFSSIESSISNNFITFDGILGNQYQFSQMMPLYNIDRVENISGPAAALYSVGTPGGVINMVTKRPLDKEAYTFNITTGSWGLIDVSTDLTGPLSKNKKFLYRLNIGYNYANSYRPYQFTQNIVIAPSLSYNFNDKTSLALDFVNADNNTRFTYDRGGSMLINKDSTYNWKGVNKTFIFNSPDDYGHINNNSLTLTFKHQFSGNFKLTYVSRATSSVLNTAEHYGNYYGANYFTAYPDSMQRRYDTWVDKPYNIINSLFTTETFGNEKFKQTIVTGIDYQVNGDSYNKYVDGAANTISWNNPNYSKDAFSNYSPAAAGTFIEDQKDQTNQFGAYIQDLVSIGSKIKVLLAGRYENFLYISRPNGADNYTQSNDTSKAHVFIPRAGLVYSFTKSHAVYGSFSESYNPQYSNYRASGGPFPPQTGKQFEIGDKAQFFGGKLMSTVALYSIDWRNILAPDPADPTGQKQIALPGLTSQGAELTLMGNFAQFSITGSYAYNNIVFAANSPLGKKGDRYDNAPHSIANLWVKYALPDASVFKGLSFSAGGKYVSDRIGSTLSAPHFLMPEYLLLDAAVNYTYKKLNIALNGFNLLNTNYQPGWYASDLMVQVGTPVNWRLSVTYSIK
ncbi:MAG: TonB-dependent receptor domain-containing protein [Sphingobacteriales bacterium]